MKRLTLIILVLLTIFSPQPARAAVSESSFYARAIVKEAYFFSEKDLATSLFAVPYTYCIRVLRDEGDWYYASYASDTGIYKQTRGYCRKQDFAAVEGEPEVTYLYKTVTVTFKSDGGNSSLPVLSEISLDAAFYGNFYSGATAYSYVYANGSFGYIIGANEDYPLNLPEENQGDGNEQPTGGNGAPNAGLITALVICGLAAAALIMLFFTTRKNGRRAD